GKLIPQKGVELLIDAWRVIEPSYPDIHLVIVGFGDDRYRLEQRAAGSRVVFTGALSHEQLQLLIPLAETVVVPSVMAEAFGMVAAEAAACGVIPIVAAHSGLAEVAEGLGEGSLTFDGTGRDLERALREVLDLPEAERRRRGRVARERAVRLWSWSSVARRMVELIAGDS
ncbi:MAG: glycosyltransferase, partial [Actinomycetota bacterium]|nr:glycosyltransferase [Actinomycetota bacterium]